MKVKYMSCPQCGAGLAAMDDDSGTAYWCISNLPDGKRCYYTKYIENEEEEKPIAPNQYQYIRYRSI